MLFLIGLGLDDREITEKGIKALESVDKAYAEFYTNTANIDIERLEEKTGTEIEILDRNEVERDDIIIDSAEERDTAFLVSGDPLTATTHYDIKHRAEQKGIETEVIHAPSIFTSIAETGLNVYKFGRTVTLPEEGSPDSIIEYIGKNDSIGLHTLILLDIDYDASDAASKLIEMDESLEEREAVILQRANHEDQEVSPMELSEALGREFGETPHSIILVGDTSHKEEEFLREIER